MTGVVSAPTLLTMRTFPSASVISSSDTLDSDTRSIRVLSFRKSMEKYHLLLSGGRFQTVSRMPGREEPPPDNVVMNRRGM